MVKIGSNIILQIMGCFLNFFSVKMAFFGRFLINWTFSVKNGLFRAVFDRLNFFKSKWPFFLGGVVGFLVAWTFFFQSKLAFFGRFLVNWTSRTSKVTKFSISPEFPPFVFFFSKKIMGPPGIPLSWNYEVCPEKHVLYHLNLIPDS